MCVCLLCGTVHIWLLKLWYSSLNAQDTSFVMISNRSILITLIINFHTHRSDLQALLAAPLLPVGVYGTSTVLTASVSSAAHVLSWLEYGIMIDIPRDAITNEGSITVQPCLSGPFILPEDHKLVSPMFFVSTNAKFAKPVALSLAHHAKLLTEEDCEEMSFVFSSMESHLQRDQPTYHFKPVSGGRFRPHSLIGTLSLHHFCAGGITRTGKSTAQSKSMHSY